MTKPRLLHCLSDAGFGEWNPGGLSAPTVWGGGRLPGCSLCTHPHPLARGKEGRRGLAGKLGWKLVYFKTFASSNGVWSTNRRLILLCWLRWGPLWHAGRADWWDTEGFPLTALRHLSGSPENCYRCQGKLPSHWKGWGACSGGACPLGWGLPGRSCQQGRG